MRALLPWLLGALVLGCDRGGAADDEVVASSVRPATLHRLTELRWRGAAEALTGLRWDGELPSDYVLYSLSTVGASEATVTPYELELYEAAAWGVATELLPDADSRDAFMGCSPNADLGTEDRATDPVEGCVEPWLAGLLREGWRRPVSEAELGQLLDLYLDVEQELGSSTVAAQAALAATMVSPHFLFIVERGRPGEGGARWLTDHELAARLAFFLTDRPPDAELSALADEGALSDPQTLEAQARRLLALPEAEEAFSRFFAEWMNLDRLALVDKDPSLYPWFTDEVRGAMAEEIELLFREVAFDLDTPLSGLLTTDIAYVDAALADLYGVGWSGPGMQRVRLGPEQDRGGLMGRAGLLTLNAHATMTSPTLRGKFVRSRLLCQDIPPPPEGVVASLEELETEGTLRDRLEQHMTDPTCASCHELMDPIGFALEHFGPAGERREEDNGLPIDATATLEGVDIDGATELGLVLADHARFEACAATMVWRQGMGAVDEDQDEAAIAALTDALQGGGGRLEPLVLALVTSEGFRQVEAAAEPGAPAPYEACDGEDDDGDDAVDEDIVAACEGLYGPGVARCVHGEWGPCVGAERPVETCDDEDNDLDGGIDEGGEAGWGADVVVVGWDELTASHGDCEPASSGWSPACNAAINRLCAADGCALTGTGTVALDAVDQRAAITCLGEAEVELRSVTYSTLATHHGNCEGSAERMGPNCNAAVHRWCAAEGLTTGFGPLENSGDDAAVACAPSAAVIASTYTELAEHHPACDGATERYGDRCSEAFHRLCRELGYASGFGPLENSGDVAYAACLGEEG